MPYFSLIFLDYDPQRKKIEKEIYSDINLTRLLGEDVSDIMSILCTSDEIYARHEVFQALENIDSYNMFEKLRNELVSLSQNYTAFKTARNKCEELLLFRRYAKKYCDVYDTVMSFDNGFKFIDILKNKMLEIKSIIDEIRTSVKETERIVEELSTFEARFTPHYKTVINDRKNENIYDYIKKLIEKLGFDIGVPFKQKEIRINDDLSNTLVKFYSEQFLVLDQFYKNYKNKLDDKLIAVKNEIEFYFTINKLAEKAKINSVNVSYPHISSSRLFYAKNACDITLFLKDCNNIVGNNIDFTADENIYFLTGANGGGKTTYVRTVALNLLLAVSGCPVFCGYAEFYPFKKIFSHFPADEKFVNSGRLYEEIERIDDILDKADGESFVFLNETYSGTDEKKGTAMTLELAGKLKAISAFGLYVTHFHEVNNGGFPMLNTIIDSDNENRRTFKIVKSSDLKSSYAYDILKKYNLTKEALNIKLMKENEVIF